MARINLFDAASLVSSAAFLRADEHISLSILRERISASVNLSEQEAMQYLLSIASPSDTSDPHVLELATQLVNAVRAQRRHGAGVDALMQGFPLSSREGLALMGLAEALLRVPDKATADLLIADKLGQGDWGSHAQQSVSPWVKGAAYSLVLASHLVDEDKGASSFSAPLIRHTANAAMRRLGEQFVCGQNIEQALANSRQRTAQGYRYSYDMLGEAAMTSEDAQRYYQAYQNALHAIGKEAQQRGIHDSPGISVKLSALHPRYSHSQRERVKQELLPRVKQLLMLAKQYGVGLNIDAEEADRLELSLMLIESLAFDPDLKGYDGLGIVVQAYQKRALPLIDYLVELAHRSGRRFMVRLVKGAYWDTEIKRAQVEGLSSYPVYTRKAHTDVSYLVCAQRLLEAHQVLYPQFATHNAHTVATIVHWAERSGITHYEFQCLYGMGEALYDQVVGKNKLNKPCRIYAPVGPHSTLLAYLVRRLLENGANSSFVNQLLDERIPLDSLLADPFALTRKNNCESHPAISLPRALFAERENSRGLDLANHAVMQELCNQLQSYKNKQWQAVPLIKEFSSSREEQAVHNPADHSDIVGHVIEADEAEVEQALAAAARVSDEWLNQPIQKRAGMLRKAADLFEEHREELIALAIREAGKTLPNAIGEMREAVDFLRYYAAQAESLPPAAALGPVVCISPWNFPLAIFTGQVSAALAVGNTVLAKPAEQTPLIAFRAVQLMHEAGIPAAALQFLPGQGEIVGDKLVRDKRVRGVVFTGSTEVARRIYSILAKRGTEEGSEIPLIAETGGQNAMIVDSTALPEQVVQDVLASAFDSAGQRCSALRVLCLQEDIADRVITMLKGAMQELVIGDPAYLATDVGPVIDEEARQSLQAHIDTLRARGHHVFQLPLTQAHASGTFVAPALIEIASVSQLSREVFGPVLHVVRYRRESLPQLIDEINATGYGLTMGVHTRISKPVALVKEKARVGNLYVNRNMIGAVVGVQPFGGEGLSGTGPKAGGPLYLHRLIMPSQARLAELEPLAGIENQAFDVLLNWCEQRYPEWLDLGKRYRELSLLGKQQKLPGPTGESNVLYFVPRGTVMGVAASASVLIQQLLAVIATGNNFVLPSSSAVLMPDDLPEIIRGRIAVFGDITSLEMNAMLVEDSLAAEWCMQLKDRVGALLPIIEMAEGEEIPLWRLFNERSVCINTTAAGGNASLVSLQQ